MYIYIHMHIYVYLPSSTTLRLDAAKGVLYEYILASARTLCASVYVCVDIFSKVNSTVIWICVYTHTYIHVCLGVLCAHSVHICMCVCRYLKLTLQLYEYVYIRIHIYIYIHVYMYVLAFSAHTLCTSVCVCVDIANATVI
jgi:hypothetical protein